MSSDHPLEQIFHPRSIAIVGVPRNLQGRGGGNFLTSLLKHGFQERKPIHLVNPNADEIAGMPVYKTLLDAPDPVDHVISSVPARIAPQLVEEAIEKGVRSIHFYTAGFAESGDDQLASMQREMIARATEAGIRVFGPNCMGLYIPEERISFEGNFPTEPGNVCAISQSGGNAMEIVHGLAERGVRFSKVISFGNGEDVKAAELFDYALSDPDSEYVVSYLESGGGRALFEAVKRCAAVKPTIILKGGLTSAGARAASSHTGSLAGSEQVFEAMCRQAGAIRAESMEELHDLLVAVATNASRVSGPRALMVGGGGGFSVLGADVIARAGTRPASARRRHDRGAARADACGGQQHSQPDRRESLPARRRPHRFLRPTPADSSSCARPRRVAGDRGPGRPRLPRRRRRRGRGDARPPRGAPPPRRPAHHRAADPVAGGKPLAGGRGTTAALGLERSARSRRARARLPARAGDLPLAATRRAHDRAPARVARAARGPARAVLTSNPAGDPRGATPLLVGQSLELWREPLASAVRDRDPQPLIASARRQIEAGAQALDLNTGAGPGVAESLAWAASVLRDAGVSAQLWLDSADESALADALPRAEGELVANAYFLDPARRAGGALVEACVETGAALVISPLGYDRSDDPSPLEALVEAAALAADQMAASGIERWWFDCLAPAATDPLRAQRSILLVRAVREGGAQPLLAVGNAGHGLPAPLRPARREIYAEAATLAGVAALILPVEQPGLVDAVARAASGAASPAVDRIGPMLGLGG